MSTVRQNPSECCVASSCACCHPGQSIRGIYVQVQVDADEGDPGLSCEPGCGDLNGVFYLAYGPPLTNPNCCCGVWAKVDYFECESMNGVPLENPFSLNVQMSAEIWCNDNGDGTYTPIITFHYGMSFTGSSRWQRTLAIQNTYPFDCKALDWTGVLDWVDSVDGGSMNQVCSWQSVDQDIATITVVGIDWA